MNNLSLKRLLVIAASVAAAVTFGFWIAEESFFWPTLTGLLCGAIFLAWIEWELSAVVTAGALFGYIVGNRGFAQAMPISGVPLFAAEITLAVALTGLVFQSAVHKTSPVRRETLNLFVLVWLVLGAGRLCIDFPRYGLLALRDAAMVYYALFFFVGQSLESEARGRRWLHGALTAALLLLPALFMAFDAAPEWFYTHLLFQGIPLILYKGDIAATFMAAGVFYFYHLVCRGRPLAWFGVLASFGGAIYPLTRAALFAMACAAVWHVVARQARLFLVLGATVAVAASASVSWTLLRGSPWEESRIYQIGEYALTIVDFGGGGKMVSYQEEGDVKGNPIDNNQFRFVWWRTVAEETMQNNPWFGGGFGNDLSSRFINEYGLSGDIDFSARSPHSIVLSTFGHMGYAGLIVLIGLLGVMTISSWRAAAAWRHDPTASGPVALWAMSWTIFISACFGVVLEGPMGAVVFWTVLGMANAAMREKSPAQDTAAPAALQPAERAGEIAASP